MPWWLADRGQTLDRESVRVRLPSSLTRRLGECNAGKNVTKIKRKKAKTNRSLGLCVLDTVDGHAQPDQYGRHVCRLGRGSARPSGCQAFLRQQDSRYWALWISRSALSSQQRTFIASGYVGFILRRSGRSRPLFTADLRATASAAPWTERRLPSDPTGTGLPHGFVLACWFRNAFSPASETSTHFLSGAAPSM